MHIDFDKLKQLNPTTPGIPVTNSTCLKGVKPVDSKAYEPVHAKHARVQDRKDKRKQ